MRKRLRTPRFIGLNTKLADDKRVQALADRIGRGVAQTVGHLAFMWCVMLAQRDYRDPANLPDSLLEQWAHWHGRRGVFGQGVRELIGTGRGLVTYVQYKGDRPAPSRGGAPRRPIPARVRRAVLERDGRRCLACEATANLSLDHITPYSRGGDDSLENLRVLCRTCNRLRGPDRRGRMRTLEQIRAEVVG